MNDDSGIYDADVVNSRMEDLVNSRMEDLVNSRMEDLVNSRMEDLVYDIANFLYNMGISERDKLLKFQGWESLKNNSFNNLDLVEKIIRSFFLRYVECDQEFISSSLGELGLIVCDNLGDIEINIYSEICFPIAKYLVVNNLITRDKSFINDDENIMIYAIEQAMKEYTEGDANDISMDLDDFHL